MDNVLNDMKPQRSSEIRYKSKKITKWTADSCKMKQIEFYLHYHFSIPEGIWLVSDLEAWTLMCLMNFE